MPEDLTDQKKRENRIAVLVVATSRTTRALVKLKKQIKHFEGHPLVGALSTRIVDLGTELLWLDNEFQDVIAGGGSIPPPGRERLEAIVAIAKDVDGLIREAQTADALLEAANAAIKLANDVKSAAG